MALWRDNFLVRVGGGGGNGHAGRSKVGSRNNKGFIELQRFFSNFSSYIFLKHGSILFQMPGTENLSIDLLSERNRTS